MKKVKLKKVKFPKQAGTYLCIHRTHGWQIRVLVNNEAGDLGWLRVKDQNQADFLSVNRLKDLVLHWYWIKGA